ncbi:butyrophilin subfamily 3 member A2-like isoform X5 [Siniperca chuatsi]|uniref:butyrophilin subfamily 3 member A2-like isoform X5 n=1 Tax=Siniperca chuatsi TaxID=119488 RepID=UPI001CE0E2F6|nr:butyrophilin subfamily 3 member A2-like isoform X5 [Siniperca chuatsi]
MKRTPGLILFCLLTHAATALSELICSHQPIVALVGDDVILPCHLEPPISAGSERVMWTKPRSDPKYIHVHQYGRLLYQQLNPSYLYRTRLFVDELTNGNVSMEIFSVKISDAGKYFCILPSIHEAASIQLTVGAVSTPIIEVTSNNNGSAVLQCESAGWYPEPEVFWLDGEGKLVSAGPTETVRGPDGLYNVSSRVTVEKRHGNNYTCRVQQQNINQTRETHIHVPDDFFMAPSSCTASTAISVLFGFMFILTVVLFVWKLRQNKSERKMRHKNENKEREGERSKEQLLTESNLEKIRKDKLRLNEELQKTEEEQKDMMQVIEALKGLTREMEKQKEKLTVQAEAAKRLAEENTKKLDSVEKEVSEKEGDKTAIKAQGYLKLREIITQTSWNLEERKTEHQQLQFNTDKLMKKTYDNINRITERKNKVENHMEQIKKQMEEIERQREVKEKREEL